VSECFSAVDIVQYHCEVMISSEDEGNAVY
jgi:hypothetical protein